jgi:ABC-type amino acid transport substrate-binding protein
MNFLDSLFHKFAWPLGALLLFTIAGPAIAQDTPAKPLRVAVYDVQPYGGQGRDGMFSGASVDLWRRVAEKINRPYQLKLVGSMEEVLSGVQNGTYDVAIGDVTITADRLKRVDFTYPAHRSGDAAVFAKQTGTMAALSQYGEALSDLGPLLAGILLFLAVTGIIMWWFERARPGGPPSDPQSTVTSWHEGIYWAVVTMTTVGYGDKTPKTAAGRAIAMIWMVASLVIVSLLTTALIAHITVNQVQGGVGETQLSDLSGKKLAAVNQSSGAEYLDDQHFAYQKFASLTAALDALAARKVDAVVNSVGALQYQVSLRYSDNIAPPNGLLARGYIGFVLPKNSPLRDALDPALVIVTSSPEWRSVEDTYFNK